MSKRRKGAERRRRGTRPAAVDPASLYIGANPGWNVVWVGTEPPFTLYRHEVVAWRIGTHQRVVPITVDDVPVDYAIEHAARLYAPFTERGVPCRVYNSVDEYHRARIAAIEAEDSAITMLKPAAPKRAARA